MSKKNLSSMKPTQGRGHNFNLRGYFFYFFF